MTHMIGAGLAGPVTATPFVDGDGVWLIEADGTRVLDASNTGAPVGHRHPAMVEAMRHAADFPVVNESRAWAERDAVADQLAELVDDGQGWVGAVRFGLSGSEVNDIALSLAQSVTGRAPFVVRERAYHGLVGLSRDATVQPQWHGGLSHLDGPVVAPPRSTEVRVVAGPDGARWTRPGSATTRTLVPGELDVAMADSAAVIVDYTQGGRYHDAAYQDAVAAAAARADALWIADEVVTGLGRGGRRMAFHGGSTTPDVVTLGKPLAGGSVPAGAVVLSRRAVDLLADAKWQNYSTFRAHPVTVHAVAAHLSLVRSDDLPARAAASGRWLGDRLIELAEQHPCVVRIAGEGLHWTVELDGPDWRSWESSTTRRQLSDVVVEEVRTRGVALSTSDEPSSLFIAPPLTIEHAELQLLVDALDVGLASADRWVGR